MYKRLQQNNPIKKKHERLLSHDVIKNKSARKYAIDIHIYKRSLRRISGVVRSTEFDY